MLKNKFLAGFTLIEILVVIGIIAVLAAAVLIAINPARQFAQARNSQRLANLNAILNGIGQYTADNKGSLKCFTDAGLNATAKVIKKPAGAAEIDVRACLVPIYLSELPVDPSSGTAYDTGTGNYNTGYTLLQDATTTRITVLAPDTEIPPATAVIQVTR